MNLLSNVVNPEMKDITIKIIGENQKELFKVNVNESIAIHELDGYMFQNWISLCKVSFHHSHLMESGVHHILINSLKF